MVRIAAKESGTLGFTEPGTYWTQSTGSGRRRSSARARRRAQPSSTEDAHAGPSVTAELEAGRLAKRAENENEPADLSVAAVTSIDSRRQ